MTANKHSLFRQRGLSLVEIMVAMVISLILLAGVVQIFLGSKTTYRVQEGLSRLQENGRFAIDILARDIRNAGFIGCARNGSEVGQIEPRIVATTVPTALTVGSAGTGNLSADESIRGADNVGAGNPLGAVAGTDTLTLVFGGPVAVSLSNTMATADGEIPLVGNPDNFEVGDILLITDCINSDIFLVSAMSGTNPTPNASLSKAYSDKAMVMRLNAISYYVRDTGRTNATGDAILALYRRDLTTDIEQELVEGIENMQITYGEDTNGDGAVDSYIPAGAVTNWANVIATRLAILANTVENVATSQTGYSTGTFSNDNPGDLKLRREFHTTVSCRNHAA